MNRFLPAVAIASSLCPVANPGSLCAGVSISPVCGRAIRLFQAVAFFETFQKTLAAGDRQAIVRLVRYPLRAQLNGKTSLLRNKAQLLRKYDLIFTSAVRCKVLAAKKSDVWGNWQGFTVADGVIWWDSSSEGAPFHVITVNNGGLDL